MRVFVRTKHGPCGARKYKPLPLSAQCTYSTDEVLAMLKSACPHHTLVNNMFLEYENETIVVENVAELRVVAACASAYHNSVVRENFRTQNSLDDLYLSCEDIADMENIEADATENNANSWDEDKDGDERVYNAEFETNADLGQPWLSDDVDAQEKWGLYT